MSALLASLLLSIGLKINEFGEGKGGSSGPASSALKFDYSTTSTSEALFL